MNPETKRILKKNLEDISKEKKRLEFDLTAVTRNIGSSETRKKYLEAKIQSLNKQTQEIVNDINGK